VVLFYQYCAGVERKGLGGRADKTRKGLQTIIRKPTTPLDVSEELRKAIRDLEAGGGRGGTLPLLHHLTARAHPAQLCLLVDAALPGVCQHRQRCQGSKGLLCSPFGCC